MPDNVHRAGSTMRKEISISLLIESLAFEKNAGISHRDIQITQKPPLPRVPLIKAQRRRLCEEKAVEGWGEGTLAKAERTGRHTSAAQA